MVFRDLKGRLCLTIHQPNSSPDERMKIFAQKDDGERLVVAPAQMINNTEFSRWTSAAALWYNFVINFNKR